MGMLLSCLDRERYDRERKNPHRKRRHFGGISSERISPGVALGVDIKG